MSVAFLQELMHFCFAITRLHTSTSNMDTFRSLEAAKVSEQNLREYHKPSAVRLIKALLQGCEITDRIDHLTQMILNHISEGNTIQKVGLFASSLEKHNILDLIEPFWRWDVIHEYNTEYFDLDKAASTEKALVRLMLGSGIPGY